MISFELSIDLIVHLFIHVCFFQYLILIMYIMRLLNI